VLLGLAVLLLVAVGLAWWGQEQILLFVVERAADRRMPVGPHREVAWDTGPDPAGRAPGERPPNVVLILADDLGWNDLTWRGGGVAGGTVPTPRIDSIAQQGADFSRGYAGNGTCAPSRAALMSGRYGTRFGFEFTPTPPGMASVVARISRGMPGRLHEGILHDVESPPYEEMGMPPSEVTLAELLKQQGYHTMHIGKWHLGRANGMGAHDQGFDESLLMASGLYLPEDDPDVVNSKQDFDPIDRFLWRALKYAASWNGGDAFEPRGYLTDYYTDEAVKAIRANRDRPFFLYLAHWAPHTPLQATRVDYDALSHIGEHRERVYAAMIRSLDRGVGRVLDTLEEEGLSGNTLVIFTSDNGGANYIGIPGVNDPYRGWKITFFEGGIRVPFFMRWPGVIPAGTVVSDPVHHFDVYATAAAAAEAPLPQDRRIDGVDLVPFARGEARAVPHDRLFWRTGHYQVALVDGWKLQVNDRWEVARLYHLTDDPTEQRDLAARMPEKVAELRRALAEHDAEQRPSAWPSQAEMAVNVDRTLAEPDSPDDEYVYWPN
jgi:uncharacterized sulfatase